MKEISESSKVMILFGVLTIFINSLKDLELKKGAKKWFHLLHKYANQMWRELLWNLRREGAPAEFVYDEMEAFIYEVNRHAFDVPLGKLNEYLEYLKRWKDELVLEKNVKKTIQE